MREDSLEVRPGHEELDGELIGEGIAQERVGGDNGRSSGQVNRHVQGPMLCINRCDMVPFEATMSLEPVRENSKLLIQTFYRS